MQPALPSTPVFETEHYLTSDKWVAQQKIDGERLLATIGPGSVTGVGRDGTFKVVPRLLKQALGAIRGEWMFDGEVIDSQYYIFDILQFPKGHLIDVPYIQRYKLLSTIFSKTEIPFCSFVPTYISAEEKKAFHIEALNSGVEGIIFREANAKYRQGRTDTLVKLKFIKTVDCFVLDTHVDNKDNIVIAVFDGEQTHVCGKVSALTGDGPRVKIGDVVEVKFLYVTGSNKLFQPTAPRLRTDKQPHECTIDQLLTLKTNKNLLERKKENA